nr:MAG TPA_asm: hypothetical protein [Bacteriophage sp.]
MGGNNGAVRDSSRDAVRPRKLLQALMENYANGI